MPLSYDKKTAFKAQLFSPSHTIRCYLWSFKEKEQVFFLADSVIVSWRRQIRPQRATGATILIASLFESALAPTGDAMSRHVTSSTRYIIALKPTQPPATTDLARLASAPMLWSQNSMLNGYFFSAAPKI